MGDEVIDLFDELLLDLGVLVGVSGRFCRVAREAYKLGVELGQARLTRVVEN